MNLELLKMFYTIARAGNLTKAAQLLNTSQSSLSRSMQLFEHQMKAKLFKRHPRGLYLTLEGEKVFKHASRIMQENEDFIRSFHNSNNEIAGDIRIITTPFLVETELIPHLLPFLEEYPHLNIDIRTVGEDFDMADTDIAIRSFIPYRPELEQLPLWVHNHALWASEDYLKQFGIPQAAQDLDNHRLLAFSFDKERPTLFGDWLSWILYVGNTTGKPRKPFLQVSSHGSLYNAACKGYGILQFPIEWIQAKKANLIQVLSQEEAPRLELFYIFNKKYTKTKKILTLYQYLYSCLNKKLT